MWSFLSDRLVYEDDTPINHIPFMIPDYGSFSGEIFRVSAYDGKYLWYDDWVSHFSREEEISLVFQAIADVQQNPEKRIHIRGISTFEVIDLIRDYYRDCGYEDELAKNYTLPDDVRLTVSVSLSHVLWCEKDKGFLNICDAEGKQYGKMCPPVRSPADLRVLQQALRMNLIMGIELHSHETPFLAQVLEKQICPLFTLSQMLYFRWERYGFSGFRNEETLELPHFLGESVEL